VNCPNCGRSLATGARQCVYCARGTGVKGSAPIVRTGAPPAPKGGLFKWVVLAFLLLGLAAGLGLPGVRAEIKKLVDRALSSF